MCSTPCAGPVPDFETALSFVFAREGGYVNDPDDPGGATNRGITQATYTEWRRNEGLASQHVRKCSVEEAAAIYRSEYWDKHHCGDLPWPLALVHFDSSVQHAAADKLLQEVLGVPVDGVIGPRTLAAARDRSPYLLALKLTFHRLDYYRSIAKGPTLKFLPGWVRRMVLLYHALEDAA